MLVAVGIQLLVRHRVELFVVQLNFPSAHKGETTLVDLGLALLHGRKAQLQSLLQLVQAGLEEFYELLRKLQLHSNDVVFGEREERNEIVVAGLDGELPSQPIKQGAFVLVAIASMLVAVVLVEFPAEDAHDTAILDVLACLGDQSSHEIDRPKVGVLDDLEERPVLKLRKYVVTLALHEEVHLVQLVVLPVDGLVHVHMAGLQVGANPRDECRILFAEKVRLFDHVLVY